MGDGASARSWSCRAGQLAAQQLEQCDAQGVQIASPIHALARELLGRHEAGRAQHETGARLAAVGDAGDAKVDTLTASRRSYDVGGLDVTVHTFCWCA
jgi:hypothetical protein